MVDGIFTNGAYPINNASKGTGAETKNNENKDLLNDGMASSASASSNYQDPSTYGSNDSAYIYALYNQAAVVDSKDSYIKKVTTDYPVDKESIEALMDEFENGVMMVADTVDAELPGLFDSEADKLAFSAEVFAERL